MRKCALELGDSPLLAKLSAGDMTAIDARYHFKCLTALYNRYAVVSSTLVDMSEEKSDIERYSIALTELVSYIDEARPDNNVAPVFKLSSLLNLYSSKLEQLGIKVTRLIHFTKIKNHILKFFPDLEPHCQGRDIVLTFR